MPQRLPHGLPARHKGTCKPPAECTDVWRRALEPDPIIDGLSFAHDSVLQQQRRRLAEGQADLVSDGGNTFTRPGIRPDPSALPMGDALRSKNSFPHPSTRGECQAVLNRRLRVPSVPPTRAPPAHLVAPSLRFLPQINSQLLVREHGSPYSWGVVLRRHYDPEAVGGVLSHEAFLASWLPEYTPKTLRHASGLPGACCRGSARAPLYLHHILLP